MSSLILHFGPEITLPLINTCFMLKCDLKAYSTLHRAMYVVQKNIILKRILRL